MNYTPKDAKEMGREARRQGKPFLRAQFAHATVEKNHLLKAKQETATLNKAWRDGWTAEDVALRFGDKS